MSDSPRTIIESDAASPGRVEVRAAEGAPPWLACALEVASVAEIVGLLIAARRTGRLDVKDGVGVRSMFFESGQYTGAKSTHPADRLGQVLWRYGRVSADQLMIADEQVKEGKLLGRALVELGFIEPASLRRALVDQAIQVFEAACVEESGHALFLADVFHKKPLRFGVATKSLVEGAILRTREHRDLQRKLGSLDRPYQLTTPQPTGVALDERSLALLQLAANARKKKLTGRELIDKAALGRIDGARALLALIEHRFIVARDSAADEHLKVKRLCAAINLVMAALDDSGFGVGDQVREWLDSPPPAFEEALSGLSLAQPLDENVALEQAAFIAAGATAMITALQAVLDDALLHAFDTLPDELTARVQERVRALMS